MYNIDYLNVLYTKIMYWYTMLIQHYQTQKLSNIWQFGFLHGCMYILITVFHILLIILVNLMCNICPISVISTWFFICPPEFVCFMLYHDISWYPYFKYRMWGEILYVQHPIDSYHRGIWNMSSIVNYVEPQLRRFPQSCRL